MKLIKMSDFVLEKNILDEKEIKQIINYANFLQQPLKLEMFVPCDESGNVLEEYKLTEKELFADANNQCRFISSKEAQWISAKEKVLFEDFYWEGNYTIGNMEDEMIYIDEEFCQNMNIEKFLTTIISDLELTESAISQIK